MALTVKKADGGNVTLGTARKQNITGVGDAAAGSMQSSAPAWDVSLGQGTINQTPGAPVVGQAASTELGNTTLNPGGGGVGGGGEADPDAALRAKLIKEILGKRGAIEEAYNALFADLDALINERSGELEADYTGQLGRAADQFADVLPTIDNSYAAIGSYDSTQRGDSRGEAKDGYDDTVETIGKNKEDDFAKLGQYDKETRAKFNADKKAANRYIDSAEDTTDVDALRGANNNLDTNLSQTEVTRASLGTNASAANSIRSMTADNGRSDEALAALDSIIKGSMPTEVKDAAVEAAVSSGIISEKDKKKVQAGYGNVYAEQQEL